ncbi:alkaline phosphatase [Parvularcula flava]|uniref:Alkaline phosphatase n=1 Tax=Aquisalinus luteolus TaxID=1566827 RepID=A0A8J3A5G1_9PROT|nr:alkaline phosphatase D family protein [Aquisalinus luteolus]NHK29092.1 alkaline phosphatase [Aquisalinus luteolus]GGI00334.1 alkaline phosphatase [Aquisalinus luteolus]
MTDVTRRKALLGTLAGSVAVGAAGCASQPKMGAFSSARGVANAQFAQGVASGDPMADRVIIWTRAAPVGPEGTSMVPVEWQVATDRDFTDASIVKRGSITTGPAQDWTVKVDVAELTPGATYYYRFATGNGTSPVGRTKTLPRGAVEAARFAVVSCSNYPFGYFNAYDHIARREEIDAVIHLGDYLYEYGPDGYGAEVGEALGRQHQPAREIVSLQDYRVRHRQYKSDMASQAMHAAHPLIAVWDDHETANNSWEGGAQNHQPETEGDWEARRRAAMQAYYEYMPVREPEGRALHQLYRAYEWGDLLTITAIETRLTARVEEIHLEDVMKTVTTREDAQAWYEGVKADESRYLMGDAQLGFVADAMGQSKSKGQPWRLVANQVIMANVTAPDLTPYEDSPAVAELAEQWPGIYAYIAASKLGLPQNLDAWDGYPAARERLYETLQARGVSDLIVLTGDTHEWWANDLYRDNGTKMGVELGTSAVTSPGGAAYLGDVAEDMSLLINQTNPSIRYHSNMTRGYIDLSLTPDGGHADFVSVSTITEPDYEAVVTAGFDLEKSGESVEFGKGSGMGLKQTALYRGIGD